MPLPLSVRLAIVSLGALVAAPALAGTNGPYLTWQNKAQAPQASNQPSNQAPGRAYDVPPSPYGQVGDPYRHTLNWPAKNQPQQQVRQQQASIEPLPRQPAAAPPPAVSLAVPRPMPRPEPVTVAPQPEPEDEDEAAPAPAPAPSAMAAPAPTPAPSVPASPTATAVTSDGGYQIPATSKYAARIAAARAAQDQQLAEQPNQDAANPAGGAAPAPASSGTSLASQETDRVFIPGEQITDSVSQEPRRYSLHRQYGLHPDPIQVDRDATGALLETHLDAQDPDDSPQNDPDSDSAKDSDDDGQNAKP
ncbi:MAG: hypothetical protein JF615_02235 [Asticcacaulis sp.]|nr:hypothetical protein [Asticcacaulis sp.]